MGTGCACPGGCKCPEGSADRAGSEPSTWVEPGGLFMFDVATEWNRVVKRSGPGWILTRRGTSAELLLMVYPAFEPVSLDYFTEVLDIHREMVGFSLSYDDIRIGDAPARLMRFTMQQGASATLYLHRGDLVFELSSLEELDSEEMIAAASGLHSTYKLTDDPTGGHEALLGSWRRTQSEQNGDAAAYHEEWIFDYIGHLHIRSSAPEALDAERWFVPEQGVARLHYWVIRDWLYLFGGDVWMVLPMSCEDGLLHIGPVRFWR